MSSPESSAAESAQHVSQPSTNPLNDMFDSDAESVKAIKNPEKRPTSGTDDEDMSDRPRGSAEGVEEDDIMADDDEGAGLFGSDDENDAQDKTVGRQRNLDDSELDSGDDEGRADRVRAGSVSDSDSGRDKSIMNASMGRMPIPEGSDGELYLLKFPSFLSIEPKIFQYETFEVPTKDHHSRHASSTFNAFTVANTALRWRRSPHDKESLQSNARILRWSDGSLTLQLANNPMEQYELPAKALAPPQHNPRIPTPTMIQSRNTANGQMTAAYDPKMDSHTYLMAPQESATLLRSTNHITTGLTVLPGNESNDEALIRLQESLAKAVKGGIAGGITRISINEDPELQKKRAEAAERDKMKAQRRKELAEQREKQRASKSNRSGRPGNRYGHGLSAGGLEDDEMVTSGGVGRKRGAQPSKKKAPRRRDDYDSDDDDRPRYYAKEDEYDRADDFLADSDEEEEYEGDGKDDDEDIDEGIDEVDEEAEENEERADRKRDRKVERKRGSEPRKEESSIGAGAAAGGARSKRRRIVDEDDDE